MKFFLEPTNLAFAAAALVSGGLLLWPAIARRSGNRSLSTLQATQMINANAVVLDVRDAAEFNNGSLTGARNIPLADLATRSGELARFKTRPVVVVCERGQRSAKAVAQLAADGFTEVYNLAGGIGAWRDAGLPLVKSTSKEALPGVKKEKA